MLVNGHISYGILVMAQVMLVNGYEQKVKELEAELGTMRCGQDDQIRPPDTGVPARKQAVPPEPTFVPPSNLPDTTAAVASCHARRTKKPNLAERRGMQSALYVASHQTSDASSSTGNGGVPSEPDSPEDAKRSPTDPDSSWLFPIDADGSCRSTQLPNGSELPSEKMCRLCIRSLNARAKEGNADGSEEVKASMAGLQHQDSGDTPFGCVDQSEPDDDATATDETTLVWKLGDCSSGLCALSKETFWC